MAMKMATALQSYELLGGIIHCLLAPENIRETPTEWQVYLRGALTEPASSNVAIPDLAIKAKLFARLAWHFATHMKWSKNGGDLSRWRFGLCFLWSQINQLQLTCSRFFYISARRTAIPVLKGKFSLCNVCTTPIDLTRRIAY